MKALYEGAKEINSEAEAAAAAHAMSKLLTAYNLTMEEVDAVNEIKDEVIEQERSGFTFTSIGGEWEYDLTYVLCKWNFCKCYKYGSSYHKLLIFGKKENIETVNWLFSLLSKRYVEFSKNRFKEYKNTWEYNARPISKDKYQRSYLVGAAKGLDAKLEEERKSEKQLDQNYDTKLTALMVRSGAEIDEFVKAKHSYSKGRKVARNYDSAYAYGFKDGKNTKFHKEVEEGQKSKVNNSKLLG